VTDFIHLREVGLRDGLQLVKGDLPTERKLEWIRREVEAGVSEIEVTSFVPYAAFPIFSDAKVVAHQARQVRGLSVSALTPNARGAEDAFDAGIEKINYVVSASRAHSLANVRRTPEEAVSAFEAIVTSRRARGLQDKVKLSCGIATAFGCTIQGRVEEAIVRDLALELVRLGADEIMIADTVGYATPGQVERIFNDVLGVLGATPVAAHFHDTRGLGLANIAAAARVGIRRFDGSLGGLGGCPHAPGATGNVVFEDAVFLLESLGFSTGIDLEKLLQLRRDIETWLPDERFSGAIQRAGLPKTFFPTSASHPATASGEGLRT